MIVAARICLNRVFANLLIVNMSTRLAMFSIRSMRTREKKNFLSDSFLTTKIPYTMKTKLNMIVVKIFTFYPIRINLIASEFYRWLRGDGGSELSRGTALLSRCYYRSIK